MKSDMSKNVCSGTWAVEYNAENRPVRWTNAETGTVITMTFDSQGRRTEYKSVTNGTQNTWLRFLYDGYLCVQVLYSNEPYNVFKEFVWDPTEPVATRPLVFRYAPNSLNLFYAFDGNKNVSDVFYRMTSNGIGAHYDYAPFGGTTRTHSDSSASFDIVALNPFRFSSEYYDSELDLVYYNYRHYSPSLGRFLSRDPIEEQGGLNLYAFVKNSPIQKWDRLGRAIPRLGAGPDGGFPIYCRDRIAEFMKWFEQEKAKLEDRDENGKNWIEKLPKCPNALRKIMRLFRTTLPSGCTYYVERLTFASPDLSEWTLTPDIVFEATQILGLLSCGMRYHPVGRYELRTRDTSKYEGHGNQCIYDNEGNLIREIPTAGTVDWVGPGGLKIEHRNADVLQFENAVRIDSACGGNGKYVRMYYEVRPSW